MTAFAAVILGAAAASANDEVGLPPRVALTTLLSTESLIFAAFSISATLALPTDAGRSLFFAKGRFAYTIVGLLMVIAACAASALYSTLRPIPPHGVNAWAQAAGVAIGIGVQPFAALAIARAARKTTTGFTAGEEN